jgi:hypothetical protein
VATALSFGGTAVAPAVRVDKRHGDEMGGARGMLRREEGRKRVAASMGRPLFYGHDGGGGRADGERHAVARGSGRGGGGVRAGARQHMWALFEQGRRGL